MEMKLSFDDVNLVPTAWNEPPSREAVDTLSNLRGQHLPLPIISSNMDTVYSPALAKEVAKHGGISVVHRFCSIDENVKLFQDGIYGFEDIKPWVSIGITDNERERGLALLDAGAEVLVIDVANAANNRALAMYNYFKDDFRAKTIVVGNFGTAEQIKTFLYKAGGNNYKLAVKVSIGSGSACTTRQNTGIGVPSFSCLQDCVKAGVPVIFDGGIKNGGDFAKAMAAGASAVMMGRLFAACEESPGQVQDSLGNLRGSPDFCGFLQKFKKYRGSASAESYAVQGKTAKHRAAEGESYLIPVTDTVEALMDHFNGCLRSTMTQQNAWNLEELRENAEFIQVTHSGNVEGSAYGKSL